MRRILLILAIAFAIFVPSVLSDSCGDCQETALQTGEHGFCGPQ